MTNRTWEMIFAISILTLLGVLIAWANALPGAEENFVPKTVERVSVSFAQDAKTGTTPNASVTFVLFGDYQCPYTSQIIQPVKTLREKYGDRVNFVFKHMPNPQIHKQSILAAMVAECAREQGMFWEFSESLFAKRRNFDYSMMRAVAEGLGMDIPALEVCIKSKEYSGQIKKDLEDAVRLELIGTPTVFINDLKLEGVYDLNGYEKFLQQELGEET